jgi:hypothetical protein
MAEVASFAQKSRSADWSFCHDINPHDTDRNKEFSFSGSPSNL